MIEAQEEKGIYGETMREDVFDFAEAMEARLKEFDESKGKDRWDTDRQEDLNTWFKAKLAKEVDNPTPNTYVDIANYCMMLHRKQQGK